MNYAGRLPHVLTIDIFAASGEKRNISVLVSDDEEKDAGPFVKTYGYCLNLESE